MKAKAVKGRLRVRRSIPTPRLSFDEATSSSSDDDDRGAARTDAAESATQDETDTKELDLSPVDNKRALNRSKTASQLPRRHKRRKYRTSSLSFREYMIATLHWILGILGSVMGLLHIPIALAMSLIVLYWVYDYSITAVAPTICRLPGTSSLEICQPCPREHCAGRHHESPCC